MLPGELWGSLLQVLTCQPCSVPPCNGGPPKSCARLEREGCPSGLPALQLALCVIATKKRRKECVEGYG